MKLPPTPPSTPFAYVRYLGAAFVYLLRWVLLASVVGVLAGSASALFLFGLEWVGHTRAAQPWLVALLPVAGLLIGLSYHYWGKRAVGGNGLILAEHQQPSKRLPWQMAPLVLGGTLLTHLVGGSAGREGTAVQMGSTLADQLSLVWRTRPRTRRLLLVSGMSAGFASVFGTPLAGAVFALEVLRVGRVRYEALLPSFCAAAVGHWVCHAWGAHHTVYALGAVPDLTPVVLLWVALVGISSGVVARLFTACIVLWEHVFARIHWPPLRPVVGGIALAALFFTLPLSDYMGLGIPFIEAAFEAPQPGYAFLLKILLTGITLGAGFKGGEVTPLFFTGAALGSTLWLLGIPLSLGLLAGLGFVAVFCGATHTPLACTLMGIELFGAQAGLYLGIACVLAYLFSGHRGIYGSQPWGAAKHPAWGRRVTGAPPQP